MHLQQPTISTSQLLHLGANHVTGKKQLCQLFSAAVTRRSPNQAPTTTSVSCITQPHDRAGASAEEAGALWDELTARVYVTQQQLPGG